MSLKEAMLALDSNVVFDGLDGKFTFRNNSIYRELDILEIKNGETKKLN